MILINRVKCAKCLGESCKLSLHPHSQDKRYNARTNHYVLITNHVHLLATPETGQSLPKTLQSVGRRYVQYFNYRYKRTGTL